MTDIDLDAIEARANAASPGPWSALMGDVPEPRCWWMSYDDPEREDTSFDWQQITKDADFVDNARDDVPALVAEVRRLRRLLDLATTGALGQYELGYNDAVRAAAGLDVADRALPDLT